MNQVFKMTVLVAGLLAVTRPAAAIGGFIGHAGGVIADAVHEAGGVLSDAAHEAGGMAAGVYHDVSGAVSSGTISAGSGVYMPDGALMTYEQVGAALSTAGESQDWLMDSACAAGVGGTVAGGMVCGGCIGGSTLSAGMTAVLCAEPCGVTAASLVTALKTCKI